MGKEQSFKGLKWTVEVKRSGLLLNAVPNACIALMYCVLEGIISAPDQPGLLISNLKGSE